jgi:hypothetical protein
VGSEFVLTFVTSGYLNYVLNTVSLSLYVHSGFSELSYLTAKAIGMSLARSYLHVSLESVSGLTSFMQIALLPVVGSANLMISG